MKHHRRETASHAQQYEQEITFIRSPEEEQTQRLATQIADDCAQAEIESHSTLRHADGCVWHDLTAVDVYVKEHVVRAITYLDQRGLLMKHPCNAQWVHFLEPALSQ